jgi:predicted TIM-barrel fold metal-dependent hydrolase
MTYPTRKTMPREAAIESDLPIIDPHHHLWDRTPYLPYLDAAAHGSQRALLCAVRYLADDLRTDLAGGHHVVATVYVEASYGYHEDGPEALRPVGETAFAVSAGEEIAATDPQGPRACASIVGHADLTLGDGVAAVLEAHVAAGRGRFRGVRHSGAWDADPAVLRAAISGPGLYASHAFRAGFARLAPLDLTFDAWLLEPQLPELVNLAVAFPNADRPRPYGHADRQCLLHGPARRALPAVAAADRAAGGAAQRDAEAGRVGHGL